MKEIFYSETAKFVLTDKEFIEAMKAFDSKKQYYCKRLDSTLSPYTKFTRPIEDNSVYYKMDNGKFRWFLKNIKVYMYTVKGVLTRIVFKDDAQQKEFEDRIVTADEFFDNGYEQE